jgi:hypothetical protein
MATDDPRVHVQFFDTSDTNSLGQRRGNRAEHYDIPIVGWATYGDITASSYLNGILCDAGHS